MCGAQQPPKRKTPRTQPTLAFFFDTHFNRARHLLLLRSGGALIPALRSPTVACPGVPALVFEVANRVPAGAVAERRMVRYSGPVRWTNWPVRFCQALLLGKRVREPSIGAQTARLLLLTLGAWWGRACMRVCSVHGGQQHGKPARMTSCAFIAGVAGPPAPGHLHDPSVTL